MAPLTSKRSSLILISGGRDARWEGDGDAPRRASTWYGSSTRVHEVAQLAPILQPARDSQKLLLLLYLGDHDPSGRGMSDLDFPKRLFRYASDNPADKDWTDEEVEAGLADWGMKVRRIALTVEDTVALGSALGFPASTKIKDSRLPLVRPMTRAQEPSMNGTIKLLRERKNLTQAQLARRVGVHVITISKYERGVQTPRLAMLVKIAKALGVSPGLLLSSSYTRDEGGAGTPPSTRRNHCTAHALASGCPRRRGPRSNARKSTAQNTVRKEAIS